MVRKPDNFALAENLLYGILDGPPSFGIHYVEDEIHGLAECLCRTPPCKCLGNGVHEGYGTVHIRSDDRVTHARKGRRGPLLAFFQSLLRPSAQREI